MNSIGWIEQGVQDLRYAFRQLRGSAGFASVVVATLGLGIGGATAVFSVVQSVLLAPLPYEEPGQLVRFYQQEPDNPDTRGVLAGTHFTFLREHATAFEDVAAIANYQETGVDLFTGGRAERLRVLRVSSGYFSVLRSPLQLGRGFDRGDERGTRRVVLSHATWRLHFGGDPAIVGATIRLSGREVEVAGIASPDFEDPIAPDVSAWIPYDLAGDTYEENNSLTAIGRLRNGIILEHARAELATLTPAMRERWPAAKKSAIVAMPLREELVASARRPLHLVFAAVTLLLLLACVNVANLALVRATGRVHEFAVRAALGSGRFRLVRQLLVESFLLAFLGGVAGLAVAGALVRVLQALGRQALPRLDDVGLDADVLLFALIATAATAVAFGIAPALRLSETSPVEALHQQSRSATGTRGLARIRGALAAAQLALALTLLAGAAILLASLHRLQQVDLGVRVERVLTFEVNLPTSRYDEAHRASFQEELAGGLETIPGVSAAGGISRLPATGSYHPWNTQIRTGPLAGRTVDRSRFAMQQRVISGNLFAAFDIPLLAGRSFDGRDGAGAPDRAVVSANFAHAAFPGVPYEGVLNQRIAAGGRELEIIGVVGNVALDVYGAPTMVVYHAHRQFAGNRNWALTHVVAADRSPQDTAECCASRGGSTRPGVGGAPGGGDGRGRRPRHEPRAIRPRADGGVRGHRAGTRRAWPVRCARVRRAPAFDRDWNPNRARGDRRTGPRAGVPSSCRRRQPWGRRRACWGFGAWTLARSTRVRHRRVRSSNPDGQRRRAHSCRSYRCLAPRAAGDARRARNWDAGRRVMPGVTLPTQYGHNHALFGDMRSAPSQPALASQSRLTGDDLTDSLRLSGSPPFGKLLIPLGVNNASGTERAGEAASE